MDKRGLTDEQVVTSREEHGTNKLTEKKTEGFWSKLWGNFNDPMIRILCVALIINIVFACLGKVEWYESVGIAAAVLLATLVSTFSEYKNENAFQKLQEEASKITCKVYRNGEIQEIVIDDIVVGDEVILQTGDKVPADGFIIEGTIAVDQSTLNGEAKEEPKIVMPENYVDDEEGVNFLNPYKIFRGSVVCSGNAVMKVTKVGDHTVYGNIASELQIEDDRDTPLKLKLKKLAKQISIFGYAGGALIAIAFLFTEYFIRNGFDAARISAYFSDWTQPVTTLVDAIMLAVIIIVMAVPEGLPLMIAIVCAQNMGKMLKDNVLVRKVSGIETAGSLNILFTDKTGTITKGQLEAVLFVDGACNEYKNSEALSNKLGDIVNLSFRYNTSSLISGEGENLKIYGGNATERAVLSFVKNKEFTTNVVLGNTIPFNSKNKYSVAEVTGDYNLTLIKGAPEKIIDKCKYYYDESGIKKPFNDKEINKKIDELAARAIRVLGVATCEGRVDGETVTDGDWTLVGVVGIRDEVRPESITAIKSVREAGIQVVMITGDRIDTAVAIAKEAGLLVDSEDLVFTSDEIGKMSDDELSEKLPHIRVIARALPSDKSRLVKLAQSLGMVVGMTGDGVNDSPALKRADVGFAMGGGTEVAKEASEIVIMDDNFNSIKKAILYGRTIYNSIRKFIVFQLTINVSAVLISFVSPLAGIENPLTITQILWINLVMDTLAALAFGGEPALEEYMLEKPKKRDESIVSLNMWSSIITGALLTLTISMVFLFAPFVKEIFRTPTGNLATRAPRAYLLTGFFAYFIFTAVFNAFNARTEKINLFDNILKNKGFLIILGIITAVQIALTYIPMEIFSCYGLDWKEWLFVLACALLIIPVDLSRKAIVNAIRKLKTKKAKLEVIEEK